MIGEYVMPQCIIKTVAQQYIHLSSDDHRELRDKIIPYLNAWGSDRVVAIAWDTDEMYYKMKLDAQHIMGLGDI
jgi:hypothetical protein